MLFLALASLVVGLDAPPAPDRLPGSETSVAQAERQAWYIVEAKFTSLGQPHERSGSMIYPRAIIKPSKVIKASGIEVLHQVRLRVRKGETTPAVGDVYTLYLRKSNRSLLVFKVARLPAQEPKSSSAQGG